MLSVANVLAWFDVEHTPHPVRAEVSKPYFVLRLPRPRRVSARLPSNFHLLRQMKVTKAKALNTYLCGASA